jgi:hypothetical protein
MYRFGKRVLLGLTLGFRDARSARSRAKRDKIVAPPVCGGGHDIRVAPDGGVGAKSQKIGRERQALPLLRAQGDGASLPQDRRRRARWYARPCRPFSSFARHLGRERAADALENRPAWETAQGKHARRLLPFAQLALSLAPQLTLWHCDIFVTN